MQESEAAERLAAERLRQVWVRYYHEVARPRECVFCGAGRIWWDGRRERSGTGVWQERAVYVACFSCRRVCCAACGRSWTLSPPGLLPRRHFDLAVAAAALAQYLFERAASLRAAASRWSLSPRTLGRVRDWVAQLAPSAQLGAWVAQRSGAPLVGTLLAAGERAAAVRDASRSAVVERAAQVLCLVESLAAAAGLASPGLSSLVCRAVRGRPALAAYRGCVIPADAWRLAAGLPRSMPM
jgi:hypothetical protein